MTHQQRNGTTIVVVAIILPVLLFLVGFAVDLAYMQQVRSELRIAADLAAKAASVELADTGSTAAAIAKGKQVALANNVGGTPLTLVDADFVFGTSAYNATSRWNFTPNNTPYNAVQVQANRTTGSADGHVGLFFSGFLDGKKFEPTAEATASFIEVDVCLVLDRSSSMKQATTDDSSGLFSSDPRVCDVPWSDSRWVALDAAIDIFIAQLSLSLADEQVALVTFSSDYTDVCGNENQAATINQALTTDLTLIDQAMTTVSTTVWNGNTEIDDGIAKGREVLNGGGTRPLARKIIVLMTDGVYTGEDPITEAQLADADDIKIYTVTYSAGANEDDMIAVAGAAGGDHYHAPDEASLEDAFRKIAGTISILTK